MELKYYHFAIYNGTMNLNNNQYDIKLLHENLVRKLYSGVIRLKHFIH